ARADAKSKLDAAAAAKDAAKAAETRKAASAKAATDAKLALEPVSIYISRTKQKLYVRRNTHKPAPDGGGEVFDTTIEAPVTIRNPEKRIGTHVFTAMARKDAGLRWTVVTIDDADDAKDALDRITIPQDVLDRIGPTASPRSSIVVSDEPLSAETNYRTEFVAVLSNQPQGGFITREPSTETFVANDNFRNDDGYGFFFQRNWSPQTGNARRWWGNQYYR
ncbi:MAG: L,D-transpeptidase, partial [Pseudolabrys sp.]